MKRRKAGRYRNERKRAIGILKAEEVKLTDKERAELERIVRQHKSPQRLVRRAKIILKAGEGRSNREIARQMETDRWTVNWWRKRWLKNEKKLESVQTEGVDEKALKGVIREALSDDPRTGAPSRFTAEQIVQMVAVACEKPEESGRPVSNWTPRELKEEVIKRGIVETISVRSVGRFLKSGGSKATQG